MVASNAAMEIHDISDWSSNLLVSLTFQYSLFLVLVFNVDSISIIYYYYLVLNYNSEWLSMIRYIDNIAKIFIIDENN